MHQIGYTIKTPLQNSFFRRFFLFSVFIFLNTFLISQTGEAGPRAAQPGVVFQLRKGPYLIYNGSNTQMQILWQLNETKECTLRWGNDISYSLGSVMTAEYGNDHQHLYTIKHLKPGTQYFYNMTVNSTDHSGSFYTAPKANSKQLKFIVYGDTRTLSNVHNSVADAIVSTYVETPDFQTFALLTGDIVTYGADESCWDNELFNPANTNIKRLMGHLPFLTAAGNHEKDIKKNGSHVSVNFNVFKKYFPYPFVWGTGWSFDYGPAHFIVLDQYLKYSNFIQLSWIKKDLAKTDKQWKFIVLHEPGWSAGDAYAHSDNKEVKHSIQPILERFHVTALFAGHNHFYSRALVNGVYHITTAGGGAPFHGIDPDKEHILSAKIAHHFCKISIDHDVLTFVAVKPDGSIIDSFTIDRSH